MACVASLCASVAFACRWVMGGLCPAPVDLGADRTDDEWHAARKRSLLTLRGYDRISLAANGEAITHHHDILTLERSLVPMVDKATNTGTASSNTCTTTKATKGRMPNLHTSERGQRYRERFQAKVEALQVMAARQRVFKAKPLPKHYTYSAVPSTTTLLEQERRAIASERRQLSLDMLALLDTLAKRQSDRRLVYAPLEIS
ncbi:hypothetical protein SPRG_04776 [Saprolegnia parasitica CBS 223.65]|uniref:Enkurin domain-containing protein n=1 Tax=Saprolegnia parasitica (strain CBS 223.65) TaxID=695850 RepID=A0A067CJG0_SAPPC|nr:hypothetical protein SPRG_04776 [Saprolegnia parasitica CBS 223.65]KDO30874.1 hypothetical protein SPRG_04776 [Saprolegnia parasitica CBS 223.65]|eukprot:XP_012198569.1 hypothetical protein SPRG_04776 [Saprolegnia parasitica CBS 223.65]